MAELQAVRSRQDAEAKVTVIVYKDAAQTKLEENVKQLVTVAYTASKANSADIETCLRGTDECHLLHAKGKDCECGAPGSTLEYRCQKNKCGRRVAGLVKDVCKMAVCECGFLYSWVEKDPYKRAEKQCKMAEMTKPKKFDGKMPEDIEKFFTDKTWVMVSNQTHS